MADWLLYEHDDGRHAVAPSAEAATFAHSDPAWHRVGPVTVHGAMAAPVVPLTEEQIVVATDEISTDGPGAFVRVARAIERAHGIGTAGVDVPRGGERQ